MTEAMIRLHGTIIHLELLGAWRAARAMRRILAGMEMRQAAAVRLGPVTIEEVMAAIDAGEDFETADGLMRELSFEDAGRVMLAVLERSERALKEVA